MQADGQKDGREPILYMRVYTRLAIRQGKYHGGIGQNINIVIINMCNDESAYFPTDPVFRFVENP